MCQHRLAGGLALIGALWILPMAGPAADWPQGGRDGSRNMVSPERGLPEAIELRTNRGGFDLANSQNVRWVAQLGPLTYSSPAVTGGKVYLGTNVEVSRGTAGAKRYGGGPSRR